MKSLMLSKARWITNPAERKLVELGLKIKFANDFLTTVFTFLSTFIFLESILKNR